MEELSPHGRFRKENSLIHQGLLREDIKLTKKEHIQLSLTIYTINLLQNYAPHRSSS